MKLSLNVLVGKKDAYEFPTFLRHCYHLLRANDPEVELELVAILAPGVSVPDKEVLDLYREVNILRLGADCENFADARNVMLGLSTGDWILRLDVDERLTLNVVYLISRLGNFPDSTHAIRIARANRLHGHIADINALVDKNKWTMDENGRVNWPDRQFVLFRRKPGLIYWVNAQHETLCQVTGQILEFPGDSLYIDHYKSVAIQERQLFAEQALKARIEQQAP